MVPGSRRRESRFKDFLEEPWIKKALSVLPAAVALLSLVFLLSPSLPKLNSFRIPSQAEFPADVPFRLLTRGVSRAELEAIRKEALEPFRDWFSESYRLSSTVFTDIEDNSDWVSAYDFYYSGEATDVLSSPAAELSLANPLLLVRPEFAGLTIANKAQFSWAKERITSKAGVLDNNFPLRPMPSQLSFIDSTHSVLTYHLSKYLNQVNLFLAASPPRKNIVLTFDSSNAFDMGFRFIAPSLENLQNISYSQAFADLVTREGAQPNIVFYAPGGQPCRTDKCFAFVGGVPVCSGLSIETLPARISYLLWREKPDKDTPPDFTADIAID